MSEQGPVERLVEAVVNYDRRFLHPDNEALAPFARMCGTCNGHGGILKDQLVGKNPYGTLKPCPNPDCIDGKEYVTAAREIDEAWATTQDVDTDQVIAWLRNGPKLMEAAQAVVDDSKVRLLFRRTLDAQARGYGPEWSLAEILAEAKKAGLTND
jgi:hypothetical protein